jgi:Indolepyruvate ferredoxin oxidoreductase, alpha and beta subunits
VILDNGTTAMTGHQPNPGVAEEILGDISVHVDIGKVVEGCGVTQLAKVRPYNLRGTIRVLEEMKAMKGVRVLIVEEPCVLYARRTLKRTRTQYAYVDEQGPEVEACHETLGCPAFGKHDGNVLIDPEMCAGCMVCLQITPKIKARKKEA